MGVDFTCGAGSCYVVHAVKIITPTERATKPPAWSCLLQAWCQVIQWPYWAVVKAIGHDGSEIWWPEFKEPYCRRGFHPQEIIHLGDRFGFVATTFEPVPMSRSLDGKPRAIEGMTDSFMKILALNNGVLVGERDDGHSHALAWVNGEIIDCNIGNTRVERLEDFQIQTFHRIKSKWWSKNEPV